MQLFALDNQTPVLASQATPHYPYQCPECGNTVFLRTGSTRQAHYYHRKSPSLCRQNKKSEQHLQAQLALFNQLPQGEAKLEHQFPEIGRIADIAWIPKQIIFEIQCSPISQQEALARNQDYASIGFNVVWILHERRFNKKHLSSAERFLRQGTCYFTQGKGIWYDQLEIFTTYRRFKGPPLPVDLSTPLSNIPPAPIQPHTKNWTLHFQGDLHDRWRQASSEDQERLIVWRKAVSSKKSFFPKVKQLYISWLDKMIKATTS